MPPSPSVHPVGHPAHTPQSSKKTSVTPVPQTHVAQTSPDFGDFKGQKPKQSA